MRGIGGREGKQAGLTKTFGHVGTGTRAQTGFELDGVPAFRGGSNRFSECTMKTRREGTHLKCAVVANWLMRIAFYSTKPTSTRRLHYGLGLKLTDLP